MPLPCLVAVRLEEDATDDPDEVTTAQAELEAFKRPSTPNGEAGCARAIYHEPVIILDTGPLGLLTIQENPQSPER